MAPLKIIFWDEYPTRNFIENAVTQGLPLLPADDANQEVIRLTLDNMALQAKLDAVKMREAESCGNL